jgi:hypothetical protein
MGLISTLFTVIVAIPGLIGIDNAVTLATMEQQCYNIESSFKTKLHGPELCGWPSMATDASKKGVHRPIPNEVVKTIIHGIYIQSASGGRPKVHLMLHR